MVAEYERKKGNKLAIGIIILLALIVIGLCLYILYDKNIIFKSHSNKISENNKKETKTQILDINSPLVQSLYEKVEGGDYFNHIYSDNDYKLNQKAKMLLVAQNLKIEKGRKSIDCSKVPDGDGDKDELNVNYRI